MRSKWILLISMIIIVLLTSTFIACSSSKTVDVPTGLTMDGDTLLWNEVSGAYEYEVRIDGKLTTVYETKYVLDFYDSQEHFATVAAVTVDGTSAESEPFRFTHERIDDHAKTVLSFPANIRISVTRLMWNNVPGNSGYRITYNNTALTTPRNVTYCDLTFPVDGNYIIRLQTIGDGTTYYSSVTKEFKVTITDGKAAPLPLDAETIKYDPATHAIYWTNRYSADAVSYQIYNNGVLEETLEAAEEVKMQYLPDPQGVTTYAICLISNDGMYATSAFSNEITFPLLETARGGLQIARSQTGSTLAWEASQYVTSYEVIIGGNTYNAATNQLSIPLGLEAGKRYTARVRAKGDGKWYYDSLWSAEYEFLLADGGIVQATLSAPIVQTSLLDDEKCRVSFRSVENADGYHVKFAKGEQTIILDVTTTEFDIMRSSADQTLVNIFALLDDGAMMSVSAYSDNKLYADSPYSGEAAFGDEAVTPAPTGLYFAPQGVVWDPVPEIEEYELWVDGEIVRVTGTKYEPSFTTGYHTFKVRVVPVEGRAVYSEEIFVLLPLRLSAPSGLQIVSGELRFQAVTDSVGYVLYANGERMSKLVSAAATSVDLSVYFAEDKEYLLSLTTYAPSRYYSDSLFSEEIFYKKTDGKEGSVFKPHPVKDAKEFVTKVADHPADYFSLVSSEYDFTDVSLTSLSTIKFSGHILGNNAVMKNMKVSSALFATVENGAEIKDVTMEIEATNFNFASGGILARKVSASKLDHFTLVLSGQIKKSGELSFGIAVYEMDQVTMNAFAVKGNGLSVTATEKMTIGAIAYKLNGEGATLQTAGSITLNADELIYNGVAIEGECALTSSTFALGVQGTATNVINYYGVTENGNFSLGSESEVAGTSVLQAQKVAFIGVKKQSVSISDSTVSSHVTITARTIEAYGVYGVPEGMIESEEDKGKIVRSRISPTLVCNAMDEVVSGFVAEISAAGITKSVQATTEWEDVSFGGMLDLTVLGENGKVQGAAIALSADRELSCTVSGEVKASAASGGLSVAGNALIAGGVLQAHENLNITFEKGAKLSLHDTDFGEVIGVAKSADKLLAAQGVLAFDTSLCEELSVSGVYGGGAGSIVVDGLTLTGAVRGTEVSFGGVSDKTGTLSGQIKSLTLAGDTAEEKMIVEGTSVYVGGVVCGVDELDLTGKVSVSANIEVKGAGKVCGFAVDMKQYRLANVAVSGALSLEGEGYLCGVVYSAGSIDNVTSSADLTAKGDVTLCGIAGEIMEGSNLKLSGATLSLTTQEGAMYGIAKEVSSRQLSARIENANIGATPLTADNGTMELYGMTQGVSSTSGLNIENTIFTIRPFANAIFAAIARNASGTISSSNISYSLNCSAHTSEIGGAFYEINGSTNDVALSAVTVDLSGATKLGGIAVRSNDLTCTDSNVNLSVSLTLSADDVGKIGGALVSTSGRTVFDGGKIELALTERKGAGQALIGGAVSELTGALVGVRTNVSLESAVSADKFGGLAAVMKGGSIEKSAAKGTINANIAGGFVAEMSDNALVKVSMSSVRSPKGAGLAYIVENSGFIDVYSLSTVYAGFLYSGDNVTFTRTYFGGVAQYSVAHDLKDSERDGVLLEASLLSLPEAEDGLVLCTYKSLAYGYVGHDFDGEDTPWIVKDTEYPYLAELGPCVTAPAYTPRTVLDGIAIVADGENVYNDLLLPRSLDADAPAIIWVDGRADGSLSVVNGVVVLTDSEPGELLGYVSGCAEPVYIVPYTVENFVAFSTETDGEGDYYLIDNLLLFKHVPNYANSYYEKNHKIARFKVAVPGGVYEEIDFPALTTSYAAYFDFSGVTLLSPTVSGIGIFGNMTGGGIKNLLIVEPSFDSVLLFADAKGVAVENVTIRMNISDGDYRVIGNMDGGSVTDLSLSYDSDAEEVTLFLADKTKNVAFLRVQFLVSAQKALPSSVFSLVCEDEGSAFEKCAVYISADLREAYPFAYTANGSRIISSLAVICGENPAVGDMRCSEAYEVTMEDGAVTLRYCDCELFSSAGDETPDISKYGDIASMPESVISASDESAQAFDTFIGNYTIKEEMAQWKPALLSQAYMDYLDFMTKIQTLFGASALVDGAAYVPSDGGVIGLNKSFSIIFGGTERTTDVLQGIVAKLFGYETASDFIEKASALAAVLSQNDAGAASTSYRARLVYDGAIYTQEGYFILPYALLEGEHIVLACVFLSPDGTMSAWINDIDAAIEIVHVEQDGSIFAEMGIVRKVTVEMCGRCSLFDIVRCAPVKYATGVSCTDVLFSADREVALTAGVSKVAFGNVASTVSAEPYAFTEGALVTPLGYDRFGVENESYDVTIYDKEGQTATAIQVVSVASWNIYDNLTFTSDAIFGTAVSFTLTPSLGEVKDGVLRFKGNGTGTLTVINLYGRSVVITVTVSDYVGFSAGDGTEESPYEIYDLNDLKMMSRFEESYFILKENVIADDPLTAPIALVNGYLNGNGKTARLTLANGISLFSTCQGTITNIRFELTASETAGALFSSDPDVLMLTGVTIVLNGTTWNVAENAEKGLLFDTVGEGSEWEDVTMVLSDIAVNAKNGGTIGLLLATGRNVRMDGISFTAKDNISLTVGGNVIFGGIVGILEGYSGTALMSDIDADVAYIITVDGADADLAAGGVIGSLYVDVKDVTVLANISVNATEEDRRGVVRLGGVVGENFASLEKITVSDDSELIVFAADACVGGVAGYSMEYLTSVTCNVTIAVTTDLRAFAGGVIGYAESCSLVQGSVTGSVTAVSYATDASLGVYYEMAGGVKCAATAGGVVGYSNGQICQYTVRNVTVSATAAGIAEGYVLAGGAAGYLSNASDLRVDGVIAFAQGGDEVAGGAVALLENSMMCSVVSDVTLTAAKKGGAIGVFSLQSYSAVSSVVCVANVGEEGSAIVYEVLMQDDSEDATGKVRDCYYYLYGKVFGTAFLSGLNVNNVKLSNPNEAYGDAIYTSGEGLLFDESIWSFNADSLPELIL